MLPIVDEYRRTLERILPTAKRMNYPSVPPQEAAKVAVGVYEVLQAVLAQAEASESGGEALTVRQ